jgi:hypothetical protein
MEVSTARSVGYRSSSTSSARSEAKKLSDGASSQQSPLRLMLAWGAVGAALDLATVIAVSTHAENGCCAPR